MGLEAVSYIPDLVATNPLVSDSVSQGDDHIRNIKTALLNTFTNFAGAAMTLTEAQLNDASRKSATETLSGDKTFSGAVEKRIGGFDYVMSPCYGGFVDSAAASEQVPTGWSVAKTGTGQYTVTHTIPNISDYRDLGISVTATSSGTAFRGASIGPSLSATTFDVYTYNASGTATDAAFNFTVVLTE